jgi:hypothetical protein
MTEKWTLNIPYRDREEPLDFGAIHDLTRDAGYNDEERSVTRELLMTFATDTEAETSATYSTRSPASTPRPVVDCSTMPANRLACGPPRARKATSR